MENNNIKDQEGGGDAIVNSREIRLQGMVHSWRTHQEKSTKGSYQTQKGHKLTTVTTGLKISMENPWLAASPDDCHSDWLRLF